MRLRRKNRIRKNSAILFLLLTSVLYLQPFLPSYSHTHNSHSGCCHSEIVEQSCCEMPQNNNSYYQCFEYPAVSIDKLSDCDCIISSNNNHDFILFDSKIKLTTIELQLSSLIYHDTDYSPSVSRYENKNHFITSNKSILQKTGVLLI